MGEKQMVTKRLADVLIDFVESNAKEPSSDKAVEILPEMASVLMRMIEGGYC